MIFLVYERFYCKHMRMIPFCSLENIFGLVDQLFWAPYIILHRKKLFWWSKQISLTSAKVINNSLDYKVVMFGLYYVVIKWSITLHTINNTFFSILTFNWENPSIISIPVSSVICRFTKSFSYICDDSLDFLNIYYLNIYDSQLSECTRFYWMYKILFQKNLPFKWIMVLLLLWVVLLANIHDTMFEWITLWSFKLLLRVNILLHSLHL